MQTNDGKIVKFWHSPSVDKNITPNLYNKKVIVYSNSPTYKMSADKVVDEKGNVLVDYDYKESVFSRLKWDGFVYKMGIFNFKRLSLVANFPILNAKKSLNFMIKDAL